MSEAAPQTKKAIKAAYENNKLHKRLCRQVGQAIGDFNMIENGDKVMVCLSGGKDSHALLDVLLTLQKRAPIHFDIVAVNLEPVVPNYPSDALPHYFTERGIPFHIERQDTLSIVKTHFPEGKNACSLCSRLRRGILYRVAGELGATKIALGHHREDILETFFLNLFFGGKLKTMPPKLRTDDGRHIVIRPLAYVKEADLARYANVRHFPIIPCSLCGLEPNQQRPQMKEMLREWEKKFPGRVENIFSSLSTVVPSHLMDSSLFGFKDLKADGVALESER
jgi:tRNA 2-thiocytidine biosynthesis protein TtcA